MPTAIDHLRSLCLPPVLVIAGMLHAQADSTLLAKGDTLRAHREWKAARKVYDGLIERHALEAPARTGRALCNWWLEAGGETVMADLNEALRLDPRHLPALEARALKYQYMKMYDRGIEDLDIVLATSKDTAQLIRAHRERAEDLKDMRRFAESKRDIDTVFALDSTDCGAMNLMAQCLFAEGHVDATFVWMERYVACDTVPPEPYMNMAYFLSESGRYAEALTWFDRAEQHGAADRAYFWNNRGLARFKSGDIAGALKDVKESLRRMPGNAYAYRNLALIHLAQGKDEEACTAMENALARGFTEQYGREVKDLYAAHCR